MEYIYTKRDWNSYKYKKHRIDIIKDKIKQFMMNNKGRWVVVNQIVDYINYHNINEQHHNDTTYYEVYTILKKELNFSWRKASQRPLDDFKSL